MLPLWRNRVYIAISPEHLSVVRLGRGFKPKLLGQVDEVIQPHASGQTVWQATVDRLSQILDQAEWQNADVEIVLSNKLVHYAVIAPAVKLKKYAAQEAFARHVLSKTYGTATKQWTLRIQTGKENEPWMINAIDQALLEKLQLICKNKKLKLKNVSPLLVPIFNYYGKQINIDPAWLVIHEPGISLCVLIKDGVIASASKLSHDNVNDLPLLLDQENLLANLSEPCRTVYLYTRFKSEISAISNMGYDIHKLEIVVGEFADNAHKQADVAWIGVL